MHDGRYLEVFKMLGVKVICIAHGKKSKYDLGFIERLASDKSQPFQSKVFSEILEEISEAKPLIQDFDNLYTVYTVSTSSKKEFDETGRIVMLRSVRYCSDKFLERL